MSNRRVKKARHDALHWFAVLCSVLYGRITADESVWFPVVACVGLISFAALEWWWEGRKFRALCETKEEKLAHAISVGILNVNEARDILHKELGLDR